MMLRAAAVTGAFLCIFSTEIAAQAQDSEPFLEQLFPPIDCSAIRLAKAQDDFAHAVETKTDGSICARLNRKGSEIPFPTADAASEDEFVEKVSAFCSNLLELNGIDEKTGNHFCLLGAPSVRRDSFVGRLIDAFMNGRLPNHEPECAILPQSTHRGANPQFFADVLKPAENWSGLQSADKAMSVAGVVKSPYINRTWIIPLLVGFPKSSPGGYSLFMITVNVDPDKGLCVGLLIPAI